MNGKMQFNFRPPTPRKKFVKHKTAIDAFYENEDGSFYKQAINNITDTYSKSLIPGASSSSTSPTSSQRLYLQNDESDTLDSTAFYEEVQDNDDDNDDACVYF